MLPPYPPQRWLIAPWHNAKLTRETGETIGCGSSSEEQIIAILLPMYHGYH